MEGKKEEGSRLRQEKRKERTTCRAPTKERITQTELETESKKKGNFDDQAEFLM